MTNETTKCTNVKKTNLLIIVAFSLSLFNKFRNDVKTLKLYIKNEINCFEFWNKWKVQNLIKEPLELDTYV